jgi:hypothetical protein
MLFTYIYICGRLSHLAMENYFDEKFYKKKAVETTQQI